MTFHRLTTPSYSGGLIAGHDKLNDPADPSVGGTGVPALTDGQKSGGDNDGTYFVGFGDDATSANTNRPHQALGENTDELDNIVHESTPRVTTQDGTAVGAVATIALTGAVFVGISGAANTQAQRNKLVHILDQTGNEIEVSGSRVVVTLIHAASVNVIGTVADGFYTNPSIDVSPSIPNGTTYRVMFGIRATLDSLARSARGGLAESIIENAGIVAAAVQAALRTLHAASGQAWNTGWDATIKALASAGLNERYRRATAEPGGTTYDAAGDGATILRDGQAIIIQYPDEVTDAPLTTAYPDKLLNALRAEPVAVAASGGWPDTTKGGDVFLFQEADVKTTNDSDEWVRPRTTGPALLEAVPRDIRATTLNGDTVLTKIDTTLVGLANPDSGATEDARRTIEVNPADYFRSGGESAIRRTDLLEVIDDITSVSLGYYRMDAFVSDNRVRVETLAGGTPDFGVSSFNVRLRWLQPTMHLGGSLYRATSDGWYPFMVMQPSRLTATWSNNTLPPAAAAFLSAASERDQIIPDTSPTPFTALAWGGFSNAGSYLFNGKLYGDGGIDCSGGRQKVNLLQRRRVFKNFGGSGTITWDPSDGSMISSSAGATTVNEHGVVTFVIDTATDNWVFTDGDSFSYVLCLQATTLGKLTYAWPANFKFEQGDDQPPLNVTGVEIYVKWDFVYLDGNWLATRTDYRPGMSVPEFDNLVAITALGNDATDEDQMTLVYAKGTLNRWFAYVGSGGSGQEGYSSNTGVHWSEFSMTFSGAHDSAFAQGLIFVVKESSDTVFSSANGNAFGVPTSITALPYKCIYAAENVIIVSATTGEFRRSIDGGDNYIAPVTPPSGWDTNNYVAAQMAVGPGGRIIAVPESGDLFAVTDTNGSVWSEVSVDNNSWVGIVYMAGVWYAMSTSATNPMYRSLDNGATWSEIVSDLVGTGTVRKIFTHKGYVCICNGSRIRYSRDGAQWYTGVALGAAGSGVDSWSYGDGGFAAATRIPSTETYLTTTFRTGDTKIIT